MIIVIGWSPTINALDRGDETSGVSIILCEDSSLCSNSVFGGRPYIIHPGPLKIKSKGIFTELPLCT